MLAILTSFWTHIDYFKLLASHLTLFSYVSLLRSDASSLSIWSIIITFIMTICYIVPEMWHEMDLIVIFHFGQFLAL